MQVRAGEAFERLVQTMARLRAPGGCPWDAEQTHRSLAVHLIEEAYETLEAIDSGNVEDLCEELGDLLLQIVFHSQIASENDGFDVAGVIDGLVAKLVERHPHVFGEVRVSGSAEVVANWEVLKKQQKRRTSVDEGLPGGLPALVFAHKAIRRASGVGYEVKPLAERLKAWASRAHEDPSDEALGELLLEVVALAGASGIDPEGALRRASQRLLDRAGKGIPET
ncbi:MAG: nucleoside triphosphate pyrophosphohydrolase [Actinomycetota bacterium]